MQLESKTVLKAATKYKGGTCLLIAIGTVFWTGVSILPGNPYFYLAQDPTTAHEIENTYQSTPLFGTIAWCLEIDSVRGFAIYSLVWCLSSFVLLYAYLKNHLESSLPFIFCILLNHPFAYTQLLWLGLADSAHYCFWFLILLSKNCLSKSLYATLAGANHPASLFVAVTFLFSNENRKTKANLLFSTLVGLLLAKAWNAYHDINIYSRTEYILDRGLWHPLYNALCNFPTLFFSYHHILWVIVVILLLYSYKERKTLFKSLLALHIIAFSSVIATDLTRCFAIIVTPLLVKLIAEFQWEKNQASFIFQPRVLLLLSFLAFITPSVFVWDASVWINSFHFHFSNFWEVIFNNDYFIPYPTGELNLK
jgi:hypothetical protein